MSSHIRKLFLQCLHGCTTIVLEILPTPFCSKTVKVLASFSLQEGLNIFLLISKDKYIEERYTKQWPKEYKKEKLQKPFQEKAKKNAKYHPYLLERTQSINCTKVVGRSTENNLVVSTGIGQCGMLEHFLTPSFVCLLFDKSSIKLHIGLAEGQIKR